MLLRPAYLSQKLIRPLRTKDGGTLRTVLDARTYMLELPEDRGYALNGNGLANRCSQRPMLPPSAGRSSWPFFYDAKLVLT